MLHLKAQESLETLKYSIKYNQQRHIYQIAQSCKASLFERSHLTNNNHGVEKIQQEITIAQQRLELFEPFLLDLISQVEEFLVEIPNSFYYQQQWHQAIDCIGNLDFSQSMIKIFASHCNQLLIYKQWSDIIIASSYNIKFFKETERDIFVLEESFDEHQQQLWQAFFSFNNPQAQETIKYSIQELSQISQELEDLAQAEYSSLIKV